MDTQLFCMQPPKKAMLCETKIISGIVAACIGARHVLHIPTKFQHVLLPSPTTPNGLLLALIRAADPAYKPEV